MEFSNTRLATIVTAFPLLVALPVWGQNCTYTVAPTTIQVAAAETTGTVDVRSQPTSCEWTAVSNVSWITISFGGRPGNPSTGNGTSGYRVLANRDAAPRTGSMTIAGRTVNLTQAAADCPFTLEPTAAVIPAAGDSGTFRVRTTCNWTASPQNEWIRVTAGTSGTGNGTVFYTVNANNTGEPRSGAIRVGSTLFAISQPATNCAVTLSPVLVNIGAAGGPGMVGVTSSCAWTAEAQAPWLHITGKTTTQVTFSADANNSLQSRSGLIRIGNQTLTVVQAAATCVINTNPASVDIPAAGGDVNVTVTSTCEWTASGADAWFRIVSGASGNGNGTVRLSAGANTGEARTGTLRIGTVSVPVRQGGGACQVTLSPSAVEVPKEGNGGSILLAAGNECSWRVAAPEWIAVDPGAGTGPKTLFYTVSPNPTTSVRTGVINASGGACTIRQAAGQFSIVNAATFGLGPVSPGLIVTIFGGGLGPDELVPGRLDETQTRFTTELGGTRVLFDGVAAPLLYVSATQLSAVVPFEIAGSATTSVAIEARGTRTAGIPVAVAAAAPGIFTIAQSGSGPAAALNQDYFLNMASNPVEAGSVVQIFGTGGGVLDTALDAGALAGGIAGVVLPVTAEIGGVDAPVLYAGAAPGLIAGLVQVNLQVPSGVAPGAAVPVVIHFGEFSTQATATIAVR
ncbi:MAG: BACON domain-containing carbohydrate-binding protein [Bryobacteraceae bacterium]